MRKHVLGLVLAIGLGWLLIEKLLVTPVPSVTEEPRSSPAAPSQAVSSLQSQGVGLDEAGTLGSAHDRSSAAAAGRLEVLDALTGRPVALPSWDRQETASGPAWRVSAPDYEPATVLCAAVQGVNPPPILLHPAGSVSLRVQAPEALREQSIRIQLRASELPKGSNSPRGIPATPEREHLVILDKDGIGHLGTVAVGDWIACAPGLALLGSNHAADPGFKQTGPNAIRVTGLPVLGETGAFSVEQGKDVLVDLRLSAGSVVTGELSLRTHGQTRDSAITLRHEQAHMSDGFPKIDRQIAVLRGTNLLFEFPGLQPGRYRLQAIVATTNDEIHLFTQRFELREAELKNLGVLWAERHEHQVVVETVDGVTGKPNDLLQAWITRGQRVRAYVNGFRPEVWSWHFMVSPRGTTRVIGIPDMARFALTVDSLVIRPEGESPLLGMNDILEAHDNDAETRRLLGLPEDVRFTQVQKPHIQDGSVIRARMECFWKREQRIRVLHPGLSTGGKLRYFLETDRGFYSYFAQLNAGATETEFLIELPIESPPRLYAARIDSESGLYSQGAWDPQDGVLVWSLKPGLEIPIRAKSGRVLQQADRPDADRPDLLWVRNPESKSQYGVPPIFKSGGGCAFVGIPPGSEVSYGFHAADNTYQPMESLLSGIEID